ncbi:MAG: DUF5829 family protein [Myxococcota bacterium]
MPTLNRAAVALVALALDGCLPTTTSTDSTHTDLPACAQETVEPGDASASPPVYFNHAYVVVTDPTDQALQTNAYLASFVDVEVRTTVRPDSTYTGTYLNFEHTYLEFFPTSAFDSVLGESGIALGDELEGGLAEIGAKWGDALDGEVSEIYPIERENADGETVPWFDLVYPYWADTYAGASINVWAMEYVPNAGETAPRTRQVERAVRYAPEKPARDVTDVLLEIPQPDLDLMRTTFSSLGFAVEDQGDGFRAVSPLDHGVGRAYHVQLAGADRVGLVAIALAIDPATPSHVEPLGDGSLEVGVDAADQATLWFYGADEADRALLNDCR